MGLRLLFLKSHPKEEYKVIVTNLDVQGEYYYGLMLLDFRVTSKFLIKKDAVILKRARRLFKNQLERLNNLDNRLNIEVRKEHFYSQFTTITDGEYVTVVDLNKNITIDYDLNISTGINLNLNKCLIQIDDYSKDFQTLIKLKNESK